MSRVPGCERDKYHLESSNFTKILKENTGGLSGRIKLLFQDRVCGKIEQKNSLVKRDTRECHPILISSGHVTNTCCFTKGSQLCHKVKYYISSVHGIFSRAKHKITRSKQIYDCILRQNSKVAIISVRYHCYTKRLCFLKLNFHLYLGHSFHPSP